MKGKHFYSHIIETSHISLELGSMDLSQEERVELTALAESQLHHTIIDTVLSELSQEDKKKFLDHLTKDNHGEIWKLLKDKVDNIEEKIKNAAEALKKELHKDIREVKGSEKHESIVRK